MNAINPYMMDFRMYIEGEWSDTDGCWRRNAVYVTNNYDALLEIPGHKIHALYVTFGSDDVCKWYMYQPRVHHMDDIMEVFDILKETLENMGGSSCMFDRFGNHTKSFTKIEFVDTNDRDYYEAHQLNFKFS